MREAREGNEEEKTRGRGDGEVICCDFPATMNLYIVSFCSRETSIGRPNSVLDDDIGRPQAKLDECCLVSADTIEFGAPPPRLVP